MYRPERKPTPSLPRPPSSPRMESLSASCVSPLTILTFILVILNLVCTVTRAKDVRWNDTISRKTICAAARPDRRRCIANAIKLGAGVEELLRLLVLAYNGNGRSVAPARASPQLVLPFYMYATPSTRVSAGEAGSLSLSLVNNKSTIDRRASITLTLPAFVIKALRAHFRAAPTCFDCHVDCPATLPTLKA